MSLIEEIHYLRIQEVISTKTGNLNFQLGLLARKSISYVNS